ncbi:insecticidal delta-endotoxin Cry8Ea1 family protein [Bacillus thuringiensis]|uniref:Crystaline entomocidal protoxin n=1 Tax=Bacillus thuringiensis TaxID=1428 RepID=A0AAW9GNM7_BACTU|nr:insecticidal delta-endotoxin Cry8Ea1 family protein [Bacillus thuringiensis]MDY0855145.1 insecticidal delta-endotoxin Cry8Ea1 family protein [Bacillus thuringiensis]MDY4395391.1 insecticidal delta-endotoxin Cry8Ea1 family protein [Bacillus thuringiensis]
MNSDIQNSNQQLNRIAKFPLSFDPTRPLPGMNYKEFLANNGLDIIKPSEMSYVNATVAIAGSLAAIIGLLLAPVTGGTSAVAGFSILAASAPFFWPASGDTFTDIIQATEQLINKKLEDLVRSLIQSRLNGLRNAVNNYTRAFELWKNNPTVEAYISEVRDRFRTLHTLYSDAVPQFAIGGYEEVLLPAYAQVANQHLLLLRDGINYADQWKLAKDDFHYGDLHYREFLIYLEEYTNHCSVTYRIGSGRSFSNSKNWAEHNIYVRNMTLWVLDTVAYFPNLDPRLYPDAVKTQTLTRKVYSDPINFLPEDTTKDATNFTTKPDLYTNLDALTIHSNAPIDNNSSYVVGIENYYSRGGRGLSLSKPFGQLTNYKKDVDFATYDDNKDIFKLDLGFNKQITNNTFQDLCKLAFYKAGPSGSPITPSHVYQTNLPANYIQSREMLSSQSTGFTHLYYTHDLADVIIAKNNPDNSKVYSIAWTHREIDRYNIITDYQTLKDPKTNLETTIPLITQLPANQAFEIAHSGPAAAYASISVTDSINFKGGNLVFCNLNIPLDKSIPYLTYFDLNFNSMGVPVRYGKYRFRLRYASNYEGTAFLQAGGTASVLLQNTMKNIIEIDRLSYGNFAVVESLGIINFSGGRLNLSIDIENPPVSGKNIKILIDKIELVPHWF